MWWLVRREYSFVYFCFSICDKKNFFTKSDIRIVVRDTYLSLFFGLNDWRCWLNNTKKRLQRYFDGELINIGGVGNEHRGENLSLFNELQKIGGFEIHRAFMFKHKFAMFATILVILFYFWTLRYFVVKIALFFATKIKFG